MGGTMLSSALQVGLSQTQRQAVYVLSQYQPSMTQLEPPEGRPAGKAQEQGGLKQEVSTQ